MALFDDPDHDKGEYQFFSENEYHIGIISTNATNGFIGASRSANMQLKGLNGISILDILYSDQPYLFLDSGWNLLGLPQTIDLSLFNAVWGYKNKEWYVNVNGFSDSQLENYGIYQLNTIEPYRGYWVLADKAMLIPYDINRTNIDNCLETTGWSLCSHIENEDIEKAGFNFIWNMIVEHGN